jgi:hypothetical protein
LDEPELAIVAVHTYLMAFCPTVTLIVSATYLEGMDLTRAASRIAGAGKSGNMPGMGGRLHLIAANPNARSPSEEQALVEPSKNN